ncbi:MAG: hypothetical protein EAZ09_09675 [Oscillatoriales cyanobacterium]|nr:MAG: hypothetical protein EAZ18_06140 [Oscillatoriales cyanobacterium]TAH22849.1 MAG: hypothetical protein EAZ09_09675 [Oscillatoriales cyanobacterium]
MLPQLPYQNIAIIAEGRRKKALRLRSGTGKKGNAVTAIFSAFKNVLTILAVAVLININKNAITMQFS